jgi:hypothetical protein
MVLRWTTAETNAKPCARKRCDCSDVNGWIMYCTTKRYWVYVRLCTGTYCTVYTVDRQDYSMYVYTVCTVQYTDTIPGKSGKWRLYSKEKKAKFFDYRTSQVYIYSTFTSMYCSIPCIWYCIATYYSTGTYEYSIWKHRVTRHKLLNTLQYIE